MNKGVNSQYNRNLLHSNFLPMGNSRFHNKIKLAMCHINNPHLMGNLQFMDNKWVNQCHKVMYHQVDGGNHKPTDHHRDTTHLQATYPHQDNISNQNHGIDDKIQYSIFNYFNRIKYQWILNIKITNSIVLCLDIHSLTHSLFDIHCQPMFFIPICYLIVSSFKPSLALLDLLVVFLNFNPNININEAKITVSNITSRSLS